MLVNPESQRTHCFVCCFVYQRDSRGSAVHSVKQVDRCPDMKHTCPHLYIRTRTHLVSRTVVDVQPTVTENSERYRMSKSYDLRRHTHDDTGLWSCVLSRASCRSVNRNPLSNIPIPQPTLSPLTKLDPKSPRSYLGIFLLQPSLKNHLVKF